MYSHRNVLDHNFVGTLNIVNFALPYRSLTFSRPLRGLIRFFPKYMYSSSKLKEACILLPKLCNNQNTIAQIYAIFKAYLFISIILILNICLSYIIN